MLAIEYSYIVQNCFNCELYRSSILNDRQLQEYRKAI